MTTYRQSLDWPGYRVGSDGSVWSMKSRAGWHRLATQVNSNGYETVGLWHNGKRTQKLVHVFVLEVFIGPRHAGMWGLHRNDNRLDNTLSNLSWGTHADNIRDAQRNHRFRVGLAHPQGKLSNLDVERMRERYVAGESQRALARSFGVSQTNVWLIVNDHRRLDTGRIDDPKISTVHGVISDDVVRHIRELSVQGYSQIKIARLIGVSIAAVRGILHGRRHHHVTV